MNPPQLLFALLIAHALCDFPLQGDFLSPFKNHRVATVGDVIWPYCLTAHALIQAGGVWLVTGRVEFAVIEFVVHWLIDYAKSEGGIDWHQDQAIHVLCKVFYVSAVAHQLYA